MFVCVNLSVCFFLKSLRSAQLINLHWNAQRKQIDAGNARNSQWFWVLFKYRVMEIFTLSYFLYFYKEVSKFESTNTLWSAKTIIILSIRAITTIIYWLCSRYSVKTFTYVTMININSIGLHYPHFIDEETKAWLRMLINLPKTLSYQVAELEYELVLSPWRSSSQPHVTLEKGKGAKRETMWHAALLSMKPWQKWGANEFSSCDFDFSCYKNKNPVLSKNVDWGHILYSSKS